MTLPLMFVASLVLTLTSSLGLFLLARIRASRRLRSAADAYAQREIAEEAQRRSEKRTLSARRQSRSRTALEKPFRR